jgi:hypothetical protein
VPRLNDVGDYAHGPVRRRLPRRVAAIAGSMLGFALVASACGSGSAPNSVAHLGNPAPTTTTAPAAASGGFPNLQQMYEADLVYAGCIRSHGDAGFPGPALVNNSHEHGVTLEGVDQNSPQFVSANSACKHLLPNDGNGPSQAQLAQMMTRALKYSQCMRSHGLPNFPDPTESANGIGLRLHGIDPNSSQFQAAQTACRSLSPSG